MIQSLLKIIQDLLKEIVDSYVAPRATVRRVIDRVDGVEDVAAIFGLAFCVSGFVLAVSEMVSGAGASLISLLVSLMVSALSFVVLSVIITGVGRLFGGQGSFFEVATAIAWHTLVTSFYTPFGTPAVSHESAELNLTPMLIVMLISSWPLAHFIAEAHRFRSTWRVLLIVYLIFVGPLLFLAMSPPEPM